MLFHSFCDPCGPPYYSVSSQILLFMQIMNECYGDSKKETDWPDWTTRTSVKIKRSKLLLLCHGAGNLDLASTHDKKKNSTHIKES